MSEKRFSVGIRRKDNEVFYSFFDGDNPLDLDNIVDLLNEQQDTISQLEQENADRLGDKIRSLDEFEKCTNKLKERIIEQQSTINKLKEENEQLRMKLKGDDYIMVSEMLSNLRKTGICDGCKNKDKPVEWYLERGFSITGRVCDRYEPE